MKNSKILMFSIAFAFLLFASCEEDEVTKIVEAEVLVEYLESANSPLGKDYVSSDMPSLMTAEAVNSEMLVSNNYIIDIRSAEDYALGHIDGAVNVASGEVLNHVETTDLSSYDKIVVACYTGQTAGWATSVLRIMGYDNAFSMKWGMCSWHADFAGKWNNSIASTYSTLFVDDDVPKGAAGDMPELTTGETTGQAILEARADAVMAEGFGAAKITSADVYANLNNYYVVNYWAAADYSYYGHIEGAMQYTPKESMQYAVDLTTLPTDKTVVVYCWSGQSGAFLSAYLRILGYDAKSLLFGSNAMIYNDLEKSKWSEAEIKGYDYVTSK